MSEITVRRSWRISAPVVALLLVAAACGGSSDSGGSSSADGADDGIGSVEVESAGPAVAGGNLTYAVAGETSGWDPTTAQWGGSSYTIANAIFDPLMAYDTEYQPQPYLAESVTSNENFTEWTIALREGIEFHDGTALDANALVANLNAHRDSPVTGSVFETVTALATPDPLTVVVTFSAPWSTFPHALTAQPGYVAAPAMFDDPQGASNPIGTGPFVFDEWIIDSRLTVVRNNSYWQEGFPYLDEIEFPVIIDVLNRSNSLTSGDIDMAAFGSQSGSQVLSMADDADAGNLQIFIDDTGETTETIIMLNTAVPPFDNPIAREAVATALNTASVSEVMFEGFAPAADGVFKPESPFYEDPGYPVYDEAGAQALVQQYEDETGESFEFSALVPPGPDVLRISQLVKEQGELTGMSIEIETAEVTQHILRTLTGDYQASAFRIPFFTHPDMLYPFIHSSGITPLGEFGLNPTQLPNAALDTALDAARATDDPAEQLELYRTVNRELSQDLIHIFVVHDVEAVVARNNVRDVTTWEFPDGTEGLGQIGSVIQVHQIWSEG